MLELLAAVVGAVLLITQTAVFFILSDIRERLMRLENLKMTEGEHREKLGTVVS